MEESRGRAVGEGLLGDQFFWEMVIEVGDEHGTSIIGGGNSPVEIPA